MGGKEPHGKAVFLQSLNCPLVTLPMSIVSVTAVTQKMHPNITFLIWKKTNK